MERTSRTRAKATLFIGHIDHLHLRDGVLATNPVLSLAALDLVHELLQLMPVRHPKRLTGEVGELAAGFLEGVSLALVGGLPAADDLAGRVVADVVLVVDIDAVPEDAVHEAVESQLALPHLCLRRRERRVGDGGLLLGDGEVGRGPVGGALQRGGRLADRPVGEAELGVEVVVALVVDAVGVGVHVTAETLLGLGVQRHPQRGHVVRAHCHNAAAGERVVEVDVVLAGAPPGNHGVGVDVLHLVVVDEGAEQGPRREEPAVEGLEQDGAVGLRQLR